MSMLAVLRSLSSTWVAIALVVASPSPAAAQVEQIGPPLPLVHPEGPAGAPLVVTLQDALQRAKQNDVQFQTSVADAAIAPISTALAAFTPPRP